MSSRPKIVALIPLRGGSKSIPDKNIKIIAGRPLCAWVLEAASLAIMLDEVYVSTDSFEIAEVVNNLGLGVKIIFRPDCISDDVASTEAVMLHFLSKVEFDVLVTLQATSPLTTSSDINQALEMFCSEQKDSMLTAVSSKRFFWSYDGTPVNYDPLCRPRRQNFEGYLMENGAFYITKRSILKRYKCRLGGNIGIFIMGDYSSVEIDEMSDWDIVERLLEQNEK